MRLRKTQPDAHRPFRTPLYPWLPIVTAVANGGLIINTIAADPKGSAIGIGMVLLGLPVYYLFRAANGKMPIEAAAGSV
jgi:APA family basic amino acid/polyamine antiporter